MPQKLNVTTADVQLSPSGSTILRYPIQDLTVEAGTGSRRPVEMARTEKNTTMSCDTDVQHTDTGAGTIKLDSKHAPEVAEALASQKVPEDDLPDGGLRAWIQVLGCFFLVRVLVLCPCPFPAVLCLWTSSF